MTEISLSFTDKQKQLFNENITATIVVVSPLGYPHITPVGVVEYKNKFYFSTEINRVKFKYILKNNKIGINILHPNGYPYLSIIGSGVIRTKSEFPDYKEVVEKLAKKFKSTAEEIDKMIDYMTKPESRILVELNPSKIYPKE